MRCKYLLLYGLLAVLPFSAQAGYKKIANGILVSLPEGELNQSKTVRLLVVNDEVLQVTASPEAKIQDKQSLVRVAPVKAPVKWNVESTSDSVFLNTGKLRAAVSLVTGEVTFYDMSGKLILRESNGGRQFTPIEVEGRKGYTTRQQFNSPEDEAFYGLGQHQSDEFNYKSKNEELYQYNTKISVPFVVSSKNYGVLFDNYSYSRYGDPRPYSNLDIFKLYDKNGKEGGLTATYYKNNGLEVFAERQESRIDYETLFTHQPLPKTFDFKGETFDKFPEGFRFRNSLVVWEGEIEPKESGVYHFKLFYGAYTKVFLDNKLVVEERWRPSWNPNSVKFTADLQAGKKVPVRIEWREGAGSYIGLKVLSPRPEEEVGRLSMWSEMGNDIDYYFIHGDSMDEVISGYRYVTGKSPIMPAWAMGFWQSRERYKTQDEILTALRELRKRKMGVDNIVMDWQYWKTDSWGSHEFDPARFSDPKGMVDAIHDLNARFMISVWPKFYPTTKNYKELAANGWVYLQAVKDSILDFVPPGFVATFYDAYAPGARKLFWKQMNDNLYRLGVDAWWMDASEPNVQDNTDIEYRKALCGPTYLGPSTKYFNAYALENAEAIYDGQRSVNPDDRVFLLTRSGFAGQQRYSTATWSGDIGTRWEDMKAQISAGLNFAMSGIPYWTMDIGGFSVENRYMAAKEGSEDLREWRELNNRWYQFGAFCPLFRSHGQYPCREIYNIAPEGSPTYQSMKYYTELRYQLMPYIYSLASKTHFEDYTIMRAMVMDYSDDEKTYDIDDQFMFGPAFMACPVYEYKARDREVYFPAGIWYDFYNGKPVQGGTTMDVDAPYERMPLFVRAGSIVPTGKVIQSTKEEQKDLTVSVYAGADGSFTLYEDNGVTYDYEKGNYATIPFVYDDARRTLTIGAREGDYPGMIRERQITVRLITPENPAGKDVTISYQGKPLVVETGHAPSLQLGNIN